MNANSAMAYAIERMGTGRRDRGGHAYVTHLAQVMVGARMLAMRYGADPNDDEMLQAAALHDTIEDTPTSAEDLLAAGFSGRVVWMVQVLSRSEGQSYAEYLANLIAAGDPALLCIKHADLQSNSDYTRLRPLKEDGLGRKDMLRTTLYVYALQRLAAETHEQAGAIDLQMLGVEQAMGKISREQALRESYEVMSAVHRHIGAEDTPEHRAITVGAVQLEMHAVAERAARTLGSIGSAYEKFWTDKEKAPSGELGA